MQVTPGDVVTFRYPALLKAAGRCLVISSADGFVYVRLPLPSRRVVVKTSRGALVSAGNKSVQVPGVPQGYAQRGQLGGADRCTVIDCSTLRLLELPGDALALVLSHVPMVYYAGLACVSRPWNKALNSDTLWRLLCARDHRVYSIDPVAPRHVDATSLEAPALSWKQAYRKSLWKITIEDVNSIPGASYRSGVITASLEVPKTMTMEQLVLRIKLLPEKFGTTRMFLEPPQLVGGRLPLWNYGGPFFSADSRLSLEQEGLSDGCVILCQAAYTNQPLRNTRY